MKQINIYQLVMAVITKQQQLQKAMNQNQKQTIKSKFKEHRKAIQTMLKQFKYNQDTTHCENMKILGSCLQSVMDVDDLSEFVKFISNKEHLPIQINFRALRIQYLSELFDDWLVQRTNTAIILQHTQTAKFRNILFKTIFMDEKQMINQYFTTLSSENKLKSFDLYQLLTNLLSSYSLYEKKGDSLTFFEKINSFQTFLEVVNKFLQNGRLLSLRKNADKYIYRQQFQMLIEYWQHLESQLSLLDHPRKNMVDIGSQTICNNNHTSIQTQTNKQYGSQLLSFVNSTLHDLNIRIEKQDNPMLLKSLNNMLNAIREQKIKVAQIQQYINKVIPYSQKNRKIQSNLTFNNKITQKRSISPIYTQRSQIANNTPRKYQLNQQYMLKIFDNLCRINVDLALNSSQLQIFFYHVGLVKAHQNFLIRNLIRKGFIQSTDDISYKQFTTILKQISKQNSKKLNNQTLFRYIDTYIHAKDYYDQQEVALQHHTALLKTHNQSHTRSDVLGLFDRHQNNRVLSRSTYNIDSEQS